MKKHRLDLTLGLLVFVIALAVRIFAARHVWAGDLSFHMGDDDDYYRIAISLVESGTYAIHGIPTAYRMPLFPLFAAFWHLIFGPQPYSPLLVFLLASALIALGTYLLGRQLGDRMVALIAGMIVAFDGGFILYSYHYMTETLFSLLVLAAMLAAERLRVTQHWRWAMAAGLGLAGATLTRANFGPFVIVVALWVVWHGRGQLPRALKHAAIIGGLVVVLWAPWIVRNYLVFDALIPFTTQGGNAYYGIYNDAVTRSDSELAYGYWVWRIPQPPQIPGHQWSEVELDTYQREVARDWIKANPAKALKVALMQPVYFWMPDGPDGGSWMRTVVIGLPTLLVFALRRRQAELGLWLALAGMLSALTIISVGVARFQIPLRPILAVTTAMFIVGLAQGAVLLRKPGARRPGDNEQLTEGRRP